MFISERDRASRIRVKKLVLNPIYVLSNLAKESLPEEDIVVVVTEDNIFDRGYNSFCLPRNIESNPLDVFYQKGYYYGTGGFLKVQG